MFFVRTNLSTFVLPNRLQAYVRQHRQLAPNIPFYGGVYCHQDKWVGGFGIILNRAAATLLVREGLHRKWFQQPDVADDVQIGRILQHMKVSCNPEAPLLFYTWDMNHSTAYHLAQIRKQSHVVFVRLKIDPSNGSRQVYANAVAALDQMM